ncbi:PaaI family thioesterase [Phaeobacter inhibens]|uniref:PaaI family thioesterase n=1 Tax=Phaeobacter inhibens TaxID=221822 RepID=UPI0021A5EBD9|nr:PaaI family thioesterase [Phaeobacter inhibens]UWS00829.1 PaaI family thioesterase [Phaeobacter inhibens]
MIEQRIRESFAKQTMMQTLGAHIAEVGEGTVTISAPILPGSRQQHGVAHAALSFAIGDSAAGYAALTLMPADSEVMTAEMKINLLAPGAGDLLRATGKVIQPGRRLIIVTAEVHAITGAEEKLIALLQGTMVPVTSG